MKRLNNSDDQKKILEKITESKFILIDSSNKLTIQKEMEDGLMRGAKYHIDKAIKQLSKTKKPGLIYLLYSLDINSYVENLSDREKSLSILLKSILSQKVKNRFH